MTLKPGYYFFNDNKGFVLVKTHRNIVKLYCFAENLPENAGKILSLCLWDSLNIEKPLLLGKVTLHLSEKNLRGECSINAGGLSPVLGYDAFALINSDEKVICHTSLQKSDAKTKETDNTTKGKFDPFNTTNPAYSWERAESIEILKQKLLQENILPVPEVSEEIKKALPKYKHILLGSYTPSKNGKNYYIIGVPGDRPPSWENNVFRWINKCVSLSEYPYFDGYKLFYFDTENGALVKAVLRTQPTGQQR